MNEHGGEAIDYARLYSEHGTLAKAAAACGMSRSVFHRLLKAGGKPATAMEPSMAEMLSAILATQAALLAKLNGAEPVKTAAPVSTGFDGLLGNEEDYGTEIFGVSGKRAKVVLEAPSSRHIRVLAIGDSHFHPGLPETRRLMGLVGHHAAATRPEHVVHIGDGSDWNSVCRHTRNDTYRAREKPSIAQDIRCFADNWRALNLPMDAAGVTASRHYTMGNHDQWLWTYEDDHPEVQGLATSHFMDILKGSGWTSSSYGEFAFCGGVGFVHVPLNLMGKPVGGQTPENTIGTQATHDVVFGHTHRFNACRRVKVGFSNQVNVVNTGGCMPEGYVGDYAHNTQGSAMTSGVLELDIFDGRIQSHKLVTTREMERKYGHLVGGAV